MGGGALGARSSLYRFLFPFYLERKLTKSEIKTGFCVFILILMRFSHVTEILYKLIIDYLEN